MNTFSQSNVLILGGGVSAERFVESFLFFRHIRLTLAKFDHVNKTEKLAKKYCLPVISYKEIQDFSPYDVIIFSIPHYARIPVLETIIRCGFMGAFLIEKPIATTISELKKVKSLCKGHSVLVPYTRRYDPNQRFFKYEFQDGLLFQWPVNNLDKCDFSIDLLPHCIDWTAGIIGDIKSVKAVEASEYRFVFEYNEVPITVQFCDNLPEQFVYINHISVPWPSYRKINVLILEHLLYQDETARSRMFHEQYQNTLVLEKLRELKG